VHILTSAVCCMGLTSLYVVSKLLLATCRSPL